MSDKPEFPSYVAHCITCGHIIAAVVDDPGDRGFTSRSVSKWIRAGLRIEQITCQAVREGTWCDCRRRPVSEPVAPAQTSLEGLL